MLKQGFIKRLIKDNVWVDIDGEEVQAYIRGVIRVKHILKLAPGDKVQLTYENEKWIINDVMERKNFLLRPKVANVDKVLIIQSAIQPDFNTFLLDKMINFYENFNVEVIVGISKLDLVKQDDDIFDYINQYKKIGYCIYNLNLQNEFKNMLNSFENKIICFVGNSGVGKSTLLNRIEPSLNLSTQAISQTLNRGKHTTTNTNIYRVNNFYLIDTPGFASIEICDDKKTIARNFFKHEIKDEKCKFNDCLHIHENGCKIKEMLALNKIYKWRYDNYLAIIRKLDR